MPMEANPIDTASAVSTMNDSPGGHELHPNSVDLQPVGHIDMNGDGSARKQLNQGVCRSSDRGAGQGQMAPALRSEGAGGIATGSSAGMSGFAGLNPDQVLSSDNQKEASNAKLDPEVRQVLQQRAEKIVLAAGSMMLIADEPSITKVLQNELLLIAFQLVQTLDVPTWRCRLLPLPASSFDASPADVR